eukprot:COSAG06_NODE_2857_length_6168_cov_7.760092_2_plen_66_part_00
MVLPGNASAAAAAAAAAAIADPAGVRRGLIVLATWAAACVRARSRRKGRLLELGAGVPWKIPVIS